MKALGCFAAAFVLAACSSSYTSRTDTQSMDAAEVPAAEAPPAEAQGASSDSVMQFLLGAAAGDFHTHGPAGIVDFRDVRLGHRTTSGGEALHMLCGEFLAPENGGEPAWTGFATIKTEGYEQWIGRSATPYCEDPTIEWDDVGDLSTSLKSRVDSLGQTK